MSYPTVPFALVYFLARITPERASLATEKNHIGLYGHADKEVFSQRFEIDNEGQYPTVEAAVASMIADHKLDTLTLTFSTDGDAKEDLGVIIEKGKAPVIFSWEWNPFGITLIDDADTVAKIDNWVGVTLARNLIERTVG